MKIIKDRQIIADDWRHLADDETPGIGPYTVSLIRWKAEREAWLKSTSPVGLRLVGGDQLDGIAEDLPRFSLIVLDFTSMADGRSFSQAHWLRESLGYAGELRARGAYIRDQVFYLSRVGVNAFETAEEADLVDLLPALEEFSVRYQAAVDVKEALYRRRSAG